MSRHHELGATPRPCAEEVICPTPTRTAPDPTAATCPEGSSLMSTWQISESGTEVVLDDQGRGEVTFVVTNTADTQDRSVLTVTPLDGAGESWFAVEQPQRLVPPKETAAYVCKVLVPTGTAAGTYALQAVAYSADRDPGETSTTSRRGDLHRGRAAAPAAPRRRSGRTSSPPSSSPS